MIGLGIAARRGARARWSSWAGAGRSRSARDAHGLADVQRRGEPGLQGDRGEVRGGASRRDDRTSCGFRSTGPSPRSRPRSRPAPSPTSRGWTCRSSPSSRARTRSSPLDPYVPAEFAAEIMPGRARELRSTAARSTVSRPDERALPLLQQGALQGGRASIPRSRRRRGTRSSAYGKKLTNEQDGVFGIGIRNSLWWSLPFFYSYGADVPLGGREALPPRRAPRASPRSSSRWTSTGSTRSRAAPGGAGGIVDDLGFQSGQLRDGLERSLGGRGPEEGRHRLRRRPHPCGARGHAHERRRQRPRRVQEHEEPEARGRVPHVRRERGHPAHVGDPSRADPGEREGRWTRPCWPSTRILRSSSSR